MRSSISKLIISILLTVSTCVIATEEPVSEESIIDQKLTPNNGVDKWNHILIENERYKTNKLLLEEKKRVRDELIRAKLSINKILGNNSTSESDIENELSNSQSANNYKDIIAGTNSDAYGRRTQNIITGGLFNQIFNKTFYKPTVHLTYFTIMTFTMLLIGILAQAVLLYRILQKLKRIT